jgi:hypothetical protein
MKRCGSAVGQALTFARVLDDQCGEYADMLGQKAVRDRFPIAVQFPVPKKVSGLYRPNFGARSQRFDTGQTRSQLSRQTIGKTSAAEKSLRSA